MDKNEIALQLTLRAMDANIFIPNKEALNYADTVTNEQFAERFNKFNASQIAGFYNEILSRIDD